SPRDLSQDAGFLQPADRRIDRWLGQAELLRRLRCTDEHESGREIVHSMRGRRRSTEAVDELAVTLDHRDEVLCGLRGRLRDLDDALQEEAQPLLPCAFRPYPLEMVVVLVAIALEIQAQIQERTPHHTM